MPPEAAKPSFGDGTQAVSAGKPVLMISAPGRPIGRWQIRPGKRNQRDAENLAAVTDPETGVQLARTQPRQEAGSRDGSTVVSGNALSPQTHLNTGLPTSSGKSIGVLASL